MKNLKVEPNRYSGAGIFSSRIICGQCRGYYGAKVWHSTSKYRRVIYQCNNKFKASEKCRTPHLDQKTIKKMFLTAVNKLLSERDEIFAAYDMKKGALFDTTKLTTAEYAELQNEMAVVSELIQKCMDENARVAITQEDYLQQYNGLVTRFENTKTRFKQVDGLIQEKKIRRQKVEAFLSTLKKQDKLIAEFNEY